jgi:hypothetical protein
VRCKTFTLVPGRDGFGRKPRPNMERSRGGHGPARSRRVAVG